METILRGQCLVAGKHLRDPNFFKTVVLLVEHGEGGATGLVINRPSSILVSHALAGHFELPSSSELVFCGGPVEPTALFMLHTARDLVDDEAEIVAGVYVGNSAEVFEQVIRRCGLGQAPDLSFRVYSGCAGWSPGQLEGELANGDWHLMPATRSQIFDCDAYEAYEHALREVYAASHLFTQRINDPSLN